MGLLEMLDRLVNGQPQQQFPYLPAPPHIQERRQQMVFALPPPADTDPVARSIEERGIGRFGQLQPEGPFRGFNLLRLLSQTWEEEMARQEYERQRYRNSI